MTLRTFTADGALFYAEPGSHFMRSVGAPFAVLVAITLMLAGCLQIGDNETEGDPFNPESDDGQTTQGEEDSERFGDDDETGSGDDAGDAGDGDPDDDANGNGTTDPDDDRACHQHARPQPEHPSQQQVEARSDLRCPGHYLILQGGSGKSWEVPEWQVGDWWYYRHEGYDGVTTSCTYQTRETVIADDQVMFDVPIYTVNIEMFDCDGEPFDHDAREENRTQHSLMLIQDDGFIQHNLQFPLREGKSWAYLANSCRDGECTEVNVYDIAYRDGSELLSTLDRWTLKWGFEGGSSSVTFNQEWSIQHNALYYEEMRVSQFPGGPLMKKQLVDSIYHVDGDGLGLGGPLGRF